MSTKQKKVAHVRDIGTLAGLPTVSIGNAIGGDAVTRKRRLVADLCRSKLSELVKGRAPPDLGTPLSPRERQTLELLLTGCAEKEVAARLAISKHTVHIYVKSLYKRFQVSSRGELLAKWVRR